MTRSVFDSYLSGSGNHFMQEGNKWFNRFDDGFFKIGGHGFGLGREVASLLGSSETAEKLDAVANSFLAGRSVVSSTRFIFQVHQVVTGQAFWAVSPDMRGWRKVLHENGYPVTIPREEKLNGIWKNEGKFWSKGDFKSVDGKYIDSPTGDYVLRDWMDIVMDVLVLVGRFLAPVRWLHTFKLYDLGKHATGFTSATMAVWGAVLTLNIVQTVRDLVEELDPGKIQSRIWDLFQGTLDLIALPFDFGLGAQHPALAIIGAVLNLISAASLLAKDVVRFGAYEAAAIA
jgi:hypothetical protein